MSEVLLNMHEFSYLRLPTQSVTYPQRCFRQIILPDYVCFHIPCIGFRNISYLCTGFSYICYSFRVLESFDQRKNAILIYGNKVHQPENGRREL
jgi:hypothetical protein